MEQLMLKLKLMKMMEKILQECKANKSRECGIYFCLNIKFILNFWLILEKKFDFAFKNI
jgi:hypothetical protein